MMSYCQNMKYEIRQHCKRISCHIVHLAHQLLHLRTSESMKLSLESLAFHILHLHIQFEDFSFLMVDLGLCFLHIRKWLCISFHTAAMFSLPREWTDCKAKSFFWWRRIWQYGLWSFQAGGTKLERFLHKNQHTQRKLLNFENWVHGKVSKIGHHFRKQSFSQRINN